MTPETIGITYMIKTYATATIFAVLGGTAHAIQQVKKSGWKGWISFFGDMFVCVFFGHVFYQIGLLIEPRYAIVLTSLGSFWGAKSFEFLKEWIITSLRANIK